MSTILVLWVISIVYVLLFHVSLKPALASIILYWILYILQYKDRLYISLITLWIAFCIPIFYDSMKVENFATLEEISEDLHTMQRIMLNNETRRMKAEKKLLDNQLFISKEMHRNFNAS
jgi:hypothetical protein